MQIVSVLTTAPVQVSSETILLPQEKDHSLWLQVQADLQGSSSQVSQGLLERERDGSPITNVRCRDSSHGSPNGLTSSGFLETSTTLCHLTHKRLDA